MRAQLLADGRQRDATLLAVLAYSGLRPQEALALPWHNVRDRTLLIDRAQSDEGLKTTKTGRTRSVRLLAPLAADLNAWRLACGRPDAVQLVFPKRSGGLWRDHDWANWRRQVFGPLTAAAGAPGMRPYDLRDAFCSLLIAEGLSVVEVAPAGRTRADDDPRHVCPRHGGPRRLRARSGGGRDPRGTSG
jgi:integrase